MANPLQRRLTLGVAGSLVLGLLFIGWHWVSWSAPAWLAEQFEPASLPDTFPEPDTVQTDRLSWNNLSFTTPEGEFSAYEVTLRFSPLSILLGRPQITELELINPLWIGPAELQPSTLGQWINRLDALAPQQLKITNATLALGEQEWLRMEAAAQRLGGSRRYHWQATGRLVTDRQSTQLNLGAILRAGEKDEWQLSEGIATFDVQTGPWTGSWRAQVRSGRYQQGWIFEYVSWSGQWEQPSADFASGIDWAGAIETLSQTETGWQLEGLDTALAFLDPNGKTQRLSALSEQLTVQPDAATGQLALSYGIGAAPESQPSLTFAVEGQAHLSADRFQWQDPAILLGLTRDGTAQSARFNAEQLTLIPETGRWRLSDGEWQEQQTGEPTQSFGFGEIIGQWPGLTLEHAPPVADRLTDLLRPIGSQLEWTDALRRALVPNPGS